ncbi:MAG TPA: addiction module protein [Nitrosopumilaceae archaeon]|nr:addiction module protein [Nitrosopumilaceae archaeon]
MDANDSASIRHKLYDYIRVVDDKKLHAIYNLLESEIEETSEWWKDKRFVKELDRRYEALESGADKGFSVEKLEASIDKLRKKRYGK